MAKWKQLKLNEEDILSNGNGELIGIEELEYPYDIHVVHGNETEKRRKRKAEEKKPLIKKKKPKIKNTVKTCKPYPFHGFNHHEKMISWNQFGLQDEILSALYDKKFFEPTEIQSQSLGPAICGHRDILGAAETGSGKTLAFGIPIVNGILKLKALQSCNAEVPQEDSDLSEEDWQDDTPNVGCVMVKNLKIKNEKNKLLAVILTPTRELAVQVKDHLTDICKYTNIRVILVVGGLAHEKQERLLNKRPEIIVATPGRLWDLIQMRNIHLQNIHKIKYLAIDETDRMLERGHFEELSKLLECININENEKSKRQNFVFSATLTLVHEPPSYIKGDKRRRITPGQKLQDLINRVGITNPKIVDITNSQITPESLLEFKVICKLEEKDYYLHYFLKGNPGKTIIFCNSIGCVKRLANLLNVMDYSPLPLHSKMIQKQRLKNLEKFKDGTNSILIATDVAARGLDILNVNHVIHYQLPKTAESYIHRSGRTARRKHFGNVMLLIEPQEYKSYVKLLHTLGRNNDIEDLEMDDETVNRLKQIVHLARDIDQLTLAVKKQNLTNSWYAKAINDMDLLVDEDEIPKELSDEGSRRIKSDLNKYRKKLRELLSRPQVSGQFSGKFPSIEMTKTLLFSQEKIVETSKAKLISRKLRKKEH